MSHRIECEECGATGHTVHKMCHGYWDAQTQRLEVFSECERTDWYCDECDTEVGVKEVAIVTDSKAALDAIVMASERLADEEDYETEIAPQLQGAIDYITKGVK